MKIIRFMLGAVFGLLIVAAAISTSVENARRKALRNAPVCQDGEKSTKEKPCRQPRFPVAGTKG